MFTIERVRVDKVLVMTGDSGWVEEGVERKLRRLKEIKGLVQYILPTTSRNGWNPEQNSYV